MSISIGMSSMSSSARDTHAAWLRMRAEDRRPPAGDGERPGDKAAKPR